jgi:hypothetical protein
MGLSRFGSENPNWKGGQTRLVNKRVAVYCPGHPAATLIRGTYALRYRLVAEVMLGRPLRADEVVHHINSDPTDDRPENLTVLTQANHAREHLAERRDPATGRMLSAGDPVVPAPDRRKACVVCRQLFEPNPRHRVRQQCCGRACVAARRIACRWPSRKDSAA